MKIKLAILENDLVYSRRITAAFQARYADKLEIYSYSNETVALSDLKPNKIDVLLASDAFDISAEQLPSRCGFAYLVDSMDVESLRGEMAICKFQKAELIYKQILSLFSENAGNISGLRLSDDACTTIAFVSPIGGAGVSTLAASCAMHYASQGRKVLYLNLEKFGSADVFFQGEGQYGLSDVIYALKSRKANLSMKLESCIRRDPNGVFYFAPAQTTLDIIELKPDEIGRLISEICLCGSYEYLILDCDFNLDKNTMDLYHKAHKLVLVSDGSTVGNGKIQRLLNALNIIEDQSDSPLTGRMVLAFNKFSKRSGAAMETYGLPAIGGISRIEHSSVSQLVQEISRNELFDKI